MRFAAHTVIVATGIIGLIVSAFAAEMTGADIKTFLSGNTAYVRTTAASASGQVGNGVIYWNADGTALYKRPLGGMMHGKWEIRGDTPAPNGRKGRAAGVYVMTRLETPSRSLMLRAEKPAPRS